jgi:hypothetical protein
MSCGGSFDIFVMFFRSFGLFVYKYMHEYGYKYMNEAMDADANNAAATRRRCAEERPAAAEVQHNAAGMSTVIFQGGARPL